MNKNISIFFITLLTLAFYSLEAAITPTADVKPVHEAFVMKYADPSPPTLITQQPPAAINEEIPQQPSPDLVWIPGYWAWSEKNGDFVWVCGVWRKPPANQIWIAGSWINQGSGWLWARGFWSSTSEENLQIIAKSPPASLNDQVPSSPGKNYFWIPGYWNYSSAGEYSWLSGTWTPLQEGLILTPAAYIWRPNGYIFVPLYWDWSLENRGVAYECQTTGPMIQMEPQTIVQNLYIYYPDYITLFNYYWVYYPVWWDGCGCMPPWWGWNDWWSLCWCDLWGLWWWWGNPGFPPPFWLSPELSLQIEPPPIIVIDAFKHVPQPDFPFTPGDHSLQPKGTPGAPAAPLPKIPNDVTPGGDVTPPHPPGHQVTPPRPPQATPPLTPPPSHPQPPRHPLPPHGQPPRPPVTPPHQPPVRPPVTPPHGQPPRPPMTPPQTQPPVRPPVTPPHQPPVHPPVAPPHGQPPVRPPVTPPHTQPMPPSRLPTTPHAPMTPNRPYPTGPRTQIQPPSHTMTAPSPNYPRLNNNRQGPSEGMKSFKGIDNR